jgi:hypothetical protein
MGLGASRKCTKAFTVTAKIHVTVSALFTLKTSFNSLLTMQGTCSLKCLSAIVNSGSAAPSYHFHRLTAFCCLHDCSSSRDVCTTCAVAVRAADEVCIAKYRNYTHVCNYLDKVKVKLTK